MGSIQSPPPDLLEGRPRVSHRGLDSVLPTPATSRFVVKASESSPPSFPSRDGDRDQPDLIPCIRSVCGGARGCPCNLGWGTGPTAQKHPQIILSISFAPQGSEEHYSVWTLNGLSQHHWGIPPFACGGLAHGATPHISHLRGYFHGAHCPPPREYHAAELSLCTESQYEGEPVCYLVFLL